MLPTPSLNTHVQITIRLIYFLYLFNSQITDGLQIKVV